jgi:hypothetical protein
MYEEQGWGGSQPFTKVWNWVYALVFWGSREEARKKPDRLCSDNEAGGRDGKVAR